MKTPSAKPGSAALSAACLALVGGVLLAPPFILAQQRPAAASAKAAPKLSGNYQSDADVLIEAQEQAVELAKNLAEKAENPRAQAALTEVLKQMERALKLLEEAKGEPKKLEAAVAAQQASYQALLKLAEREFKVNEKKSSKQGKGGEQGRQGQLDQLELKMTKNRYEQQKQAQAEAPQQSPEQKENLQFMSRLRELAQRQGDLNERLKELQTALQEAKTEPEKEEIRRQLKRLREEQQQMLAELDELKQRAEKPENQQRMAELKEKLEQTREAAQKAGEQMEKGNVSQALASGTRAERDMKAMREDLRKKNANQFAEDMQKLRQDARDISQKQEDLGKQLTAPAQQQSKRKSLTEPDAKSEVPQQLAEQNKRLADLVDRATQIAEQSENAEPLLHRQLYDAIRKQAQNEAQNLKETKNELTRRGMMTRGLYEMLEKASEQGTTKSLEVASELAKNGMNLPASGVEQRARAGIEELRKGVERAAESVLGDETESLKQAAKTLDHLTRQLENEIARGEGKDGKQGEPQDGQQPSGAKGKQGQQAKQDGEGKQPGKQGDGKSGQNSKGGKQGEAQAGAEPGDGNEPGEKGGKQGSKSGQDGKQGDGKEGSKSGQGGKQGDGKQGDGKETGKSGQGGQQPGDKEGKDGKGGKGSQPGQKQGEQLGEGQGKGGGSGQQPDGKQANASQRGAKDGSPNGNQRGGTNQRGGDRSGFEGILPAGVVAERGGEQAGPITSERGFAEFSDRLRDVEEMVDSAELRNQLQTARERLRNERLEFKRDGLKPTEWNLVRMQVMKPLVEVRQRLEEELAKRDNREAMVPIDRDPVPGRFSELVRKYYENLGKDGGK